MAYCARAFIPNLYKLLFSHIFMKRGALVFISIVFFLATLIFSIGIVAAACAQDDVILKLSSQTNAHAENASMSFYPVEICYSHIFGSNYNGADRYKCTGNNVVLRLSYPTNAHAEGRTETTAGYDNLCYGDLNCVLESSVCTGRRYPVVNLYSPNNAHLENASLSNYNYIVCCSSAGAASNPCGNGSIDTYLGEQCDPPNPPTCSATCKVETVAQNAYWASGGSAVANTFMLHVGEEIELIATGAPAGTTIIFEIWDNDTSEIGGGPDDAIKNITAIADSSGTAKAITSFNYNAFSKGDSDSSNHDDHLLLELYFIAQNKSVSYKQPSSNHIFLNNTISVIIVDKRGCVQFETQDVCEDENNPRLSAAIAYEEEKYEEKTTEKVAGVGCSYSSDTNKIVCSCAWNTTATKDKCYFKWKNITRTPSSPNDILCTGGCNVRSDYGECINDNMLLTYLTTFGVDPTCPVGYTQIINPDEEANCNAMNNQHDDVPCGLAPSLMLPFFGGIQFWITTITFILIYTLIILKHQDLFHKKEKTNLACAQELNILHPLVDGS